MHCSLCNSGVNKIKYHLDDMDVLECNDCGLVFTSMVTMGDQSETLYDQEYYRSRKDYFCNNSIIDGKDDRGNDSIKDFIQGLESIESVSGNKGILLDVGCGLGIFLSIAKKRGWEVIGLDVSEYAAEFAKKKLDIEVMVGRLSSQSAMQESIDVVTLWDSIEHIHDPLKELMAINRITKMNGILLLNTPNESSLMRRLARFCYIASGKRFLYPIRKLYHNFHLFYFNEETINKMLNRCGFDILQVKRKTIPLIKARGRLAEKVIVWLMSIGEKVLSQEYELQILARKVKSLE